MFPELFSLGPITLKTYGLFVALGALVTLAILKEELHPLGISASEMDNLFFILLTSAIIGSRLLYVASNDVPLKDFYKIWEGGLSFLGGVGLAAGSAVLWIKKRRLPFLSIADASALALPLGHAIGRLGCLAAACCWGLPTTSILGIKFINEKCVLPRELLGAKLHPTQLYEALGLIAIHLFLRRCKKKLTFRLFGFYLLGYGLLRFTLEFWRGDAEPGLFTLTLAQTLAAALLVPCGLLWIKLIKPAPRAHQNYAA